MDFTKYHIAGNDIVVIDGRRQNYPKSPQFYAQLANRRTGVGFDQAMIVMEPERLREFADLTNQQNPKSDSLKFVGESGQRPDGVDAAYVVFNADGSISAQCGNGLCAMAHSLWLQDGKDSRTWMGLTRVVKTQIESDNKVVADMGVPDFDVASLPYTGIHDEGRGQLHMRDNQLLKFYLVSLSNPHAVIFLDQRQKALFDRLELIGADLNNNDSFPDGVNLSLVFPESPERALIKVYERGVGPTLSCGSASCAAIACARRWFGVRDRLSLIHPGGEISVQWTGDDQPIFLNTKVTRVYGALLNEEAFDL